MEEHVLYGNQNPVAWWVVSFIGAASTLLLFLLVAHGFVAGAFF